MKLLLSQKMDELKMAREISSSQEKSLTQLQVWNLSGIISILIIVLMIPLSPPLTKVMGTLFQSTYTQNNSLSIALLPNAIADMAELTRTARSFFRCLVVLYIHVCSLVSDRIVK